MRVLAAAIAAIYGFGPAVVHAQVTTAPTPAPVSPVNLMPGPKVYVDPSKFPKARKGYTDRKLVFGGCDTGDTTKLPNDNPTHGAGFFSGCNPTNGTGRDLSSGAGSFRIFCSFVKIAFDDPIVWPGQAGRTHGHQFFGNDTTDFRTDVNKMDEIGGSSCGGGIFNRTGYWAPFMVDTLDGTPIITIVANFYYKSWDYSIPVTQWPTKGTRIIAGDPSAVDVDPIQGPGRELDYECWNNETGGPVNNGSGNPTDNTNPPTGAAVVSFAGTSLTINSGNISTYEGKILETTSNSAVAITIASGANPVQFEIRQKGTGAVTLVAGSGVTLSTQHGLATGFVEGVLLVNYAANNVSTIYNELPYRFDHIPSAAQAAALKASTGGTSNRTCNVVKMNLTLPQCMKAVGMLDSPDHKSHLAHFNPNNVPQCPVGYSAGVLPSIEGLFHFVVDPTKLDRIRLSSDYSKQGAIDAGLACATAEKNYCSGITGHMDWVNGWDQTTNVLSSGLPITRLIIRNCYPSAFGLDFGRNCSDQVIGDVNSDGKHWLFGF